VSYTAAVVVGLACAALLDLVVLRTRLLARVTFWATYPIILVFQLISNGVLTGRGVVRYAPRVVTGWRIGYAPVEDLGFGFALVLATLSLWVWLGRRGVDQDC
jgi:lycopene cyclase domain-containing protein